MLALDKPFIWIILPIFLTLYFLPTVIAARKRIGGLPQLFLINLLLGWFVVTWFFILDWARSANPEKYRDVEAIYLLPELDNGNEKYRSCNYYPDESKLIAEADYHYQTEPNSVSFEKDSSLCL